MILVTEAGIRHAPGRRVAGDEPDPDLPRTTWWCVTRPPSSTNRTLRSCPCRTPAGTRPPLSGRCAASRPQRDLPSGRHVGRRTAGAPHVPPRSAARSPSTTCPTARCWSDVRQRRPSRRAGPSAPGDPKRCGGRRSARWPDVDLPAGTFGEGPAGMLDLRTDTLHVPDRPGHRVPQRRQLGWCDAVGARDDPSAP